MGQPLKVDGDREIALALDEVVKNRRELGRAERVERSCQHDDDRAQPATYADRKCCGVLGARAIGSPERPPLRAPHGIWPGR